MIQMQLFYDEFSQILWSSGGLKQDGSKTLSKQLFVDDHHQINGTTGEETQAAFWKN